MYIHKLRWQLTSNQVDEHQEAVQEPAFEITLCFSDAIMAILVNIKLISPYHSCALSLLSSP
jgi:hypothetical protein